MNGDSSVRAGGGGSVAARGRAGWPLGMALARRAVMPVGAALLAVTTLAAAPAAAQELEAGRALFEGRGTCFACHGKGAVGTPVAPNLTDGEWLHFEARPTPEQLVVLVKAGVPKPLKYPAAMMPRGGSSLSDAELETVVRWLLSLSEPPPGGG